MKYKILAVLFDLDGVVAFTDKYHYMAWKKLADDQGWAFDETVNRELRGVSRTESLRRILRHNQIHLPDERMRELAEIKNGYYLDFLENIGAADLYPGAIEFVKECRCRGAKTALCSSSRNAKTVLDKLEIGNLFDAVVTGDEIAHSKPHPEIFLKAAERLDVNPNHCLVLEDAVSGIEAASRAGMKSLGVGPADHLPNAPDAFEDYGEIDIEVLLGAGHKNAPAPDPWHIVEEGIHPLRAGYWESIFALSNGYAGLRGTYDEADPAMKEHATPGMFLNGVYEYRDLKTEFAPRGTPTRLHAMVNIFDWRIFGVVVEGERFSPFAGRLLDSRRRLNMREGTLERDVVWESPSGKKIRIESVRLVSMVRRCSAAVRFRVTPLNFSGCVGIESKIVTAAKTEALPGFVLRPQRLGILDGNHYAACRMPVSGIRTIGLFAHAVDARQTGGHDPCRGATDIEADTMTTSWSFQAEEGECITIDKIAVFCSEPEPAKDAASGSWAGTATDALLKQGAVEMRKNCDDGFDAIRDEQAGFWKDFWSNNDIRIEGSLEDQQAVRLCLFHLRQSHPEDGRRSISANGLTGERYMGMVFWDTEIYMLPFFLYSQPELARDLLAYRHGILDEARRHARQIDDGPGAFYSWSSINGEDWNTVHHQVAGYHLNADIGYAIRRYALQTRDKKFLYGPGAEVLFETARALAHLAGRVPLRENRFCMNYVVGPDENAECVNNNCYTNMMTAQHLAFAAQLFDEMRREAPDRFAAVVESLGLAEEEIKHWRAAADEMYIPYHEELGIHMQDDSFLFLVPVDMRKVCHYTENRMENHPMSLTRLRIVKQADVLLLMFLLGDRFSAEQKRDNYEYYEPLTQHTSSLSPGIHSILAAEIGREDEAYAYFRDSAGMDLHDIKHNTADGVHLAAMGATWMAVVHGMAGMRDYADKLLFFPRLPAAWSRYAFQVAYRGRRIGVTVEKDRSTFALLQGDDVNFEVAGRSVRLTKANPRVAVS